ncbi:Hsp20/alpha crystallin family protein [Streptomyces sp. MS2.AVA.5]|uniref:Hsp20/alpha crystallin family protein n=1 Tax=Streptomyces achmelvichensis TaxID=3134111 RepID=A0ACC6Q7X2_9ACTN
MTTPVRRHRSPGAMERPLGWTRSPLAEFDELISQMGGLLESTVGTPQAAGMAPWTPSADVTEADDAYYVEIEFPGVKSKDIDVEVSGQDLIVTGEIKDRERKGVLRRNARRTGRFEYRVVLPSEVNTEGVKADMSEGVLTVTVPKADVAKPRHVEITERTE